MGSSDFGVRRFFERAADVLDNLDDATKDLMLSLIDPNNREEPQSRCEERSWQIGGTRQVSSDQISSVKAPAVRPKP